MDPDLDSITSWRTEGLLEKDGIMIGSDHALESWIPFWFANYSKYNNFPITVADFGMSLEMRKWCEKRWEVITVDLPLSLFKNRMPLIQQKLSRKGKLRPQKRYCWFRIPFALLKTPYRRTIWMDLDCLVMGKIDELFGYAENPFGVALGEDNRPEKIKTKIEVGIIKPGEKHFNCGVMPYLHGTELIQQWAASIIEKEGYYLGNQVFFLELLSERGINLPTLPKKYNWIVPESGVNRNATILHFIEDSKDMAVKLLDDFYKTHNKIS